MTEGGGVAEHVAHLGEVAARQEGSVVGCGGRHCPAHVGVGVGVGARVRGDDVDRERGGRRPGGAAAEHVVEVVEFADLLQGPRRGRPAIRVRAPEGDQPCHRRPRAGCPVGPASAGVTGRCGRRPRTSRIASRRVRTGAGWSRPRVHARRTEPQERHGASRGTGRQGPGRRDEAHLTKFLGRSRAGRATAVWVRSMRFRSGSKACRPSCRNKATYSPSASPWKQNIRVQVQPWVTTPRPILVREQSSRRAAGRRG